VSEPMLEHAGDLHAFAAQCRADGFTDAVLLGMGGSSLGPEVIRRSFGEIPDGLRLTVLDSTHPDAVLGVQDSIDLDKTLFVVSSKSGSTIETLSHYKYFSALVGSDHFVVITDPGSPLERLAAADGLRRCFLNPPDIGGRYSVLSYFGLVPAALMGVSIEALLHRCQVAEQMCAHYDSSESNSGLWFGAVIGELARWGRDKLTFLIRRRSRASGCGPSSSSRSRPENRAHPPAGSSRSSTSRSATRPMSTGTTGCSCTAATSSTPRSVWMPRSSRSRRLDTQP